MASASSYFVVLLVLVSSISVSNAEVDVQNQGGRGLDTANHLGSYLCQQTCDCGTQHTNGKTNQIGSWGS